MDAIRVEATPARRRAGTVAQALLVVVLAALAALGMRVATHFWPARDDPEIARALWLFAGIAGLAGLTVGWLILLIQDLVKLTIEIDGDGVRVRRLLQPFVARWDEIREIGLVERTGHLTLRSARGTLTATAGLLGPAPFAALVGALRAHAGPVVRDWTPWAAARRQLVLFAVPATGLAFLVLIGQGLWRRRAGPRRFR